MPRHIMGLPIIDFGPYYTHSEPVMDTYYLLQGQNVRNILQWAALNCVWASSIIFEKKMDQAKV
jgi:hypothetical protein